MRHEIDAPATGLRDRRRTRTRRMIQDEAMRLFAAQGYEHTTVEQIAAAAAISPRTFFRYFPTRADVVLWDESEVQALELLHSRPAGEPVAESLRHTIRSALAFLLERDAQRLFARVKLSSSHPELRAREAVYRAASSEALATLLADKHGLPADELGIRVIVEAVITTSVVALDRWQRDNGRDDLLDLFDEACDALITHIADLAPSGSKRGVPSERRARSVDS